jgi:ribonuclease-3
VLGSGVGRTKKAAEQQAAEVAWRAITADSARDDLTPGDPGSPDGPGGPDDSGDGDGTDPNRES